MAAPQAAGPEQTFRLTVADSGNLTFLATVHPPSEPGVAGTPQTRAPVDLCCVIDVSGSMDDDAAVPSEQDKPMEVTGLNVMDVTKHAMRTIIASLGEQDRLAIVSFSSSSKTVADLSKTTEDGKKTLLSAVDKLQPDAATNLWDGLKRGMNLLNEHRVNSRPNEKRLQSLFILTDGMPNVSPPRGHIPMLQQYLETNPDTRFNVNTFGFGYALDSKLLSDIANVGGGGYNFIPDAGMVGTVFVHALANLFATCAPRTVLNVELPEGTTLKPVKGSYPVTQTSWGAKVDIGDIQYGQTREFIVEVEGNGSGPEHDLTISVLAQPWFASEPKTVSQTVDLSAPAVTSPNCHLLTQYRLDLVSTIYDLCDLTGVVPNDHVQRFKATAAEINRIFPDDPNATALATDIQGELALAVTSQDNWKKWGRHYFPSIARSHQRQQCSNFRDPGLQVYGKDSPLFTKSRDAIDAAFDNLPPPKPSKKVVERAATQNSRGVKYQALTSMQQYNSRSAPCFTGDSLVRLADGTEVRIDALKRGSLVATPLGARSVAVVVKTSITAIANANAKGEGREARGRGLELCYINGLKVTPWHPILHENKWVFPADVVTPREASPDVDAIYSFLLQPHADDAAHAMIVGGVTCVTLGHGLTGTNGTNARAEVEIEAEKDVRVHPFFGSYPKVLNALITLPGFYEPDGIVQCVGAFRGEDGLVGGFVAPEETSEVALIQPQLKVSVTA